MTVVEGGASSSKYRTLSFIVALVFLSTFLSYSNSFCPRLPTLPWSLFHRPSRFLLSPSSHSHRLPRHHDYKFKIGSAALRPDGVLKAVLTINGLFPAPTIEVMAGDTLSIEVTNGLEEGTSLHWHGLRIASQWDGAPGVSQVRLSLLQ
jgi:FtsP/CotA-like multicopper oxidase with cupredoxin domain